MFKGTNFATTGDRASAARTIQGMYRKHKVMSRRMIPNNVGDGDGARGGDAIIPTTVPAFRSSLRESLDHDEL